MKKVKQKTLNKNDFLKIGQESSEKLKKGNEKLGCGNF